MRSRPILAAVVVSRQQLGCSKCIRHRINQPHPSGINPSVDAARPVVALYCKADPSQAEGLAAYAYAHSDPVDNADPSGTKPVNGNCGPDMMYCGGLPGGEYDYPLDPQPGDPCYYDIYCYYDGTATAADIAQIDAANAAFIAEGEALSQEINAEQAGNDAAAAAAATIALIDETACGAIPDCVDTTGNAVAAGSSDDMKCDLPADEQPQLGDVAVIGRMPDTEKYRGIPGYDVLNISQADWTICVNTNWIGSHAQNRDLFLAVSPYPRNLLTADWYTTVYAQELTTLGTFGYLPVGWPFPPQYWIPRTGIWPSPGADDSPPPPYEYV